MSDMRRLTAAIKDVREGSKEVRESGTSQRITGWADRDVAAAFDEVLKLLIEQDQRIKELERQIPKQDESLLGIM